MDDSRTECSLSASECCAKAVSAAANELVVLSDGRRLTKTELYKHAIAIDSSYGPAYRGLAYTMYNSPGGGPRAKTTLEDGTTMTVVDLCKKSLELEVGSG
eukprot:Sspe_Gene.115829::Locus_103975_Transcript_1_2_Confidence_0.667_Length_346::g.115829::m.115829